MHVHIIVFQKFSTLYKGKRKVTSVVAVSPGLYSDLSVIVFD